MDYSITLRHIKNVKELVFPFPCDKGVYVLTGANGSGKSSLLIALARLGNRIAFKQYKVNNRIDRYRNASVEYRTPQGIVQYTHRESRWVPSPKKNASVLTSFPFTNTCLITTSGNRFFTQEQLGEGRLTYSDASPYIKDAMNAIMDTTKFNNLQYITIRPIRGRQRRIYRDGKLYVIRNAQGTYSEQNFSLGERLLLNTLETLETVLQGTLVLIDEIELSLHPIAQVKFYDMLKKEAQEKDLCIVISTHSSTLIKHANRRIYLEPNDDGKINVLDNCYPTYILRTISSENDRISDFIFFVEDDMAKLYLQELVSIYIQEENKNVSYAILPVGGYKEVVKFVSQISTIGVNINNTQAVLDADVKNTIQNIRNKPNPSKSERNKLNLFDQNIQNISYLPITPEVGVWQWIMENEKKMKDAFDNKFGIQNYSVEDIILQVSQEEQIFFVPREEDDDGSKTRKWAKGCFKNFVEKVNTKNPQLHEIDILQTMVNTYTKATNQINEVKAMFGPLFNR